MCVEVGNVYWTARLFKCAIRSLAGVERFGDPRIQQAVKFGQWECRKPQMITRYVPLHNMVLTVDKVPTSRLVSYNFNISRTNLDEFENITTIRGDSSFDLGLVGCGLSGQPHQLNYAKRQLPRKHT